MHGSVIIARGTPRPNRLRSLGGLLRRHAGGGGGGGLVYRTFVFHYVMGHCTAQSCRGGTGQCRWVSYNTSGRLRADKYARASEHVAAPRFVIKGNDRARGIINDREMQRAREREKGCGARVGMRRYSRSDNEYLPRLPLRGNK